MGSLYRPKYRAADGTLKESAKFDLVINLKTAKSSRHHHPAVAAAAGGSGHRVRTVAAYGGKGRLRPNPPPARLLWELLESCRAVRRHRGGSGLPITIERRKAGKVKAAWDLRRVSEPEHQVI